MKHLFLSCLLVSAISVNAQSTFYVNQSSGSNDNPGTEAAPWASLNADKWTDGCTVILQGEYYMDATETNDIKVNATLKGSDGAVIYGYETGESDISDYATFFTNSNKKLTVKDLTITNYNNSGNKNGGIFQFGEESELVLDNVTISNSFLGGTASHGGAIYTAGKLTATNTTIENCTACQGGAIYIAGSNPATFTSCTFLNNNTNIGKECNPRGGVFYVQSGDDGSNLSIDKCYFEGNSADSSADSYRKYAIGGCIALVGVSPTISVTNSTFYKNVGGYAGSFIGYDKDESAENSIDMRISNNTFLDNTALSTGTNHGVLIYFNGVASDKIKGLFSYVNNSSVNNNTSNPQSVIFINSCPFDIVIANNLSLDQKTVNFNGEDMYLGYGYVLEETYPTIFSSYQILHNIIEGGIGGTRMAITSSYLDNNLNIGINVAYRPLVCIAEQLSMQNGIGYLPISAGGYGIDNGVNSVIYNNTELVPATDILGNTANGKRDLGSWEFDGIESGIGSVAADNVTIAYNNDVITVSKAAHVINVYDINGTLVANAANTDNVSTANLNKGVYVVVAIVDNAPVTKKIIR